MKLGEVADISSGIIVQRLQARPSDKVVAFYPLLSLKNFSNNGICREDQDIIRCMRELSDDELTREGNVVLRSTAPFDALYIDSDATGIIVPHFFFLITPGRIDGKFLAAWLNSIGTKLLLEKQCEGSALKTIKRRQLIELELPALNRAEQDKYAEIDSLARKERHLQITLSVLRFRLAQQALAHMTETTHKGGNI